MAKPLTDSGVASELVEICCHYSCRPQKGPIRAEQRTPVLCFLIHFGFLRCHWVFSAAGVVAILFLYFNITALFLFFRKVFPMTATFGLCLFKNGPRGQGCPLSVQMNVAGDHWALILIWI